VDESPESAALTSGEQRVLSLSRRIEKWDRRRRWQAAAVALLVSLGIVLIALAADLLLRGFDYESLLREGPGVRSAEMLLSSARERETL
jgi:hypothetical protein